ncbi:hypothetical protein [Pseudomonas syringae]|uniref:hypothetical protein n=1 Tax=Pseudomonas syringae TaxID=317 RepID=UPI0004672BD0|nr:hypothetical protein [Pseudomonas syringae]QGG78982.1 hypothetical protein N028_27035 [Pseudomonas syringae USA011]
MSTTEEEMREALFGSGGFAVCLVDSQAQLNTGTNESARAAAKRKVTKNFVPKLLVTLRVGNEYEGSTELITHEADTLSRLQAEVDAMKIARKKYRYVELVSVKPAK